MRNAYLLLGLAFILIIVGAGYALNHSSIQQGDTVPITSQSKLPMASSSLTITSSAFAANASIPAKYTCDDQRDLNPPLSISGVPADAKSLALIMDDPDVPKAVRPDGMFDHWVLFNIPVTTTEIGSGQVVGVAGANGAGKNAYTGPCPPTQYEPSEHRYFFKLYALDAELTLTEGASKADVEKAMEGHIIAQAQLIGRYKRP